MLTTRLAASMCLLAGMMQTTAAFADDGRSYQKVSFYFAAHEDDWQLFMNPSAFSDVAQERTKTVFVHTTAGDAGLGAGEGGRKYPYYLARERGAETAISFMADSGYLPLEKSMSPMQFNGHRMVREQYRNAVAYFLRLPDGHPSGDGFDRTGHQSLQRLANGKITSFAAVDGSTVYNSWNDLVSTLRALIDYERGGSSSIQLNVAELDSKLNPGDHSDHLATAKAALDAAAGLPCARRVSYVDYVSSHLAENLNAHERDMESSVLAVTAVGILALDHTSIWQAYQQSYLGRNYFRVEEATGRCDNPVPQDGVVSRQANVVIKGK